MMMAMTMKILLQSNVHCLDLVIGRSMVKIFHIRHFDVGALMTLALKSPSRQPRKPYLPLPYAINDPYTTSSLQHQWTHL